VILVPLEEISNSLLGGKGAGLTFVVYGAIIVLIARFQPGGILTLINRELARRAKSQYKEPQDKEPQDKEKTLAAGASHAP
jgi:branched-chain amino acid transport system permease protein